MEILNKRPKGMSYEKYREHLKEQKEYLANKLKGTVVHFTAPSRNQLNELLAMAAKNNVPFNPQSLGQAGTYRGPIKK